MLPKEPAAGSQVPSEIGRMKRLKIEEGALNTFIDLSEAFNARSRNKCGGNEIHEHL